MDGLEWIENIPNHLTFDSLEFKPHKLALDLDELEQYGGLRESLKIFKSMIHARMTFNGCDDVWISVVGGGPTCSNIDNDVWEVFSSELEDPIPMTRGEITEHMKLLQNIS